MIALFAHAGIMKYPLLICSVLSVYIFVYKWITLNRSKFDRVLLCRAIKQRCLKNGMEATIQDLQLDRTVPANIASEVLKISHLPGDLKEDAIKEILIPEVRRLESQLPILSLIISVAPMLGLLGTVMGLIQIFNVLAGGGIGNPMALSGGIAEALITTVSGLGIAVCTMFFHHFTHHKAEKIISDLELMAFQLIVFVEIEKG